jgi:hypothetical protein
MSKCGMDFFHSARRQVSRTLRWRLGFESIFCYEVARYSLPALTAGGLCIVRLRHLAVLPSVMAVERRFQC